MIQLKSEPNEFELLGISAENPQMQLQFKTLLDNASDPICAFTANGAYIYANLAFINAVQMPEEQILGENIWNFYPDQNREQNLEVIRWVIDHGEPRRIETHLTQPGGNRYYLTSMNPIKNSTGQVNFVFCISTEITEQKQKEAELFQMSTQDMLTKLYNRNFFEVEMKRLQVSRLYPVSIVVADMDHLKGINNSFGHRKGDEILQVSADCFQRTFRAGDITARIGGDEFGVLLPSTDSVATSAIVERLKTNLEGLGNPLVRISIGMATTRGDEELTSVYKRADEQMYRMKMAIKISRKI